MDKPVDVVERVRNALAQTALSDGDTLSDMLTLFFDKPDDEIAVLAKAAIAEVVRTMGEPSEEMLVAACGDASRVAVTYEENTQVFAAMLTAWARENGVG